MKLTRIDGSAILDVEGKRPRALLEEAILRRLDLTDVSLDKVDMSGLDFSGLTLFNADLQGCFMDHCNFTGTNLRRAAFISCQGERTTFHGADLDEAEMKHCIFSMADFSGAQLSRILISRSFFTDCRFYRARGHIVSATSVRFTNCQMDDMILSSTRARNCQFTACDFSNSDVGKLSYEHSSAHDCKCETLSRRGEAFRPNYRQATEESAFQWALRFDELRRERGYTPDWLAKAVGCSRKMILDLAHGKGIGDLSKLIALMRVFNLSLADLYYYEVRRADSATVQEPGG